MPRSDRVYVFLTALFVAALIAGDFIGGKFFGVAGRSFSAGIIAFPLTFVLTDVVNELYGKQGARRLTYAGLVAALFVFGVVNLALWLPTVEDSPMPDQVFRGAFGISSRLYLASLVAYLIGQLLDVSVFQALRKATGERFLWLRATGSTVLSQAIDSLTVSFVFLVGMRPTSFIVGNAANNYVGKLLMAVLLTPLVYLAHALVQRYLAPSLRPPLAGAGGGRARQPSRALAIDGRGARRFAFVRGAVSPSPEGPGVMPPGYRLQHVEQADEPEAAQAK